MHVSKFHENRAFCEGNGHTFEKLARTALLIYENTRSIDEPSLSFFPFYNRVRAYNSRTSLDPYISAAKVVLSAEKGKASHLRLVG